MIAALVLVAAACGSTSQTSGGPATTSVPVALDSAQLHQALLTVDDLPPGWSTTNARDLESRSPLAYGQMCANGQATLKKETHDAAAAGFVDSARGALAQGLVTAPDAEAHVADLRNAFGSCVGQPSPGTVGGTP